MFADRGTRGASPPGARPPDVRRLEQLGHRTCSSPRAARPVRRPTPVRRALGHRELVGAADARNSATARGRRAAGHVRPLTYSPPGAARPPRVSVRPPDMFAASRSSATARGRRAAGLFAAWRSSAPARGRRAAGLFTASRSLHTLACAGRRTSSGPTGRGCAGEHVPGARSPSVRRAPARPSYANAPLRETTNMSGGPQGQAAPTRRCARRRTCPAARPPARGGREAANMSGARRPRVAARGPTRGPGWRPANISSGSTPARWPSARGGEHVRRRPRGPTRD